MIRSQMMRLGGHEFHVRRSGPENAPVILALHGFPEYSGAWAGLMAALPDYHLIAPDQRGYGQSWTPQGVENYRGGPLAGDMGRLIEALGGPVTVLGHDWGAAVAYALAIKRPDLVDRLIILNGVHPACFQTALARGGAQSRASAYIDWLRAPGAEEKLAADNYAKLLSLFSAHMDMSWLSGERLAAYRTEWSRPGRLTAMLNWYRASPLKVAAPGKPFAPPAMPTDTLRITMPHLVIWGENDTALLPESLEGLDGYAPDLTVETVAGADHWLHHTHTDQVAGIIHTWFSSRI